MKEIKPKKEKKPTDRLSEKQTHVVIELIKDGRATDDHLRKALNLGDSTSAGYHRKKLEKEGVIKGYMAEIDWEKLGYPAEFIILCEGEDSRSLYEMERDYIKSIIKYADKGGDTFTTPTAFGKVLIKDVLHCSGDKMMTLIKGHAASDLDVIAYSRQYLLKYPGIEVTVLNVKSGCNIIQNFFVKRGCLKLLENSFKEVRMR